MPEFKRIHVVGASGCGTTTMGQALSGRLGHAFFDADDFFWQPTTPPYTHKRSRPERLALALAALARPGRFVLSGSICGWGAELEQSFDLVVFLTVPWEVRRQRLVAREMAKLGHVDPEFIDWARRYDNGGLEMRSRAMHEQWLGGLACPVIRLDGERPVEELVAAVVSPEG